MATTTFDIVSAQSGIDWTGRKINGSHNGTIAIKAGTITLENDKVTGGKFVSDTKSIKILDVADPGTNAQFAGHLASDDFFSSDAFPKAVFETNAVVRQAHRSPYPVRDEIPFG
jgi:polyisoprenoid-binding protein YceI